MATRPKYNQIFRVDYREQASGIPELLMHAEARVSIVPLKEGDYLINNALLVERKTAVDFMQSLISGRLFKQCEALCKSGYHPFLLIEGNPYKTSHRIAFRAVRGAIISIMAGWRIPVMSSRGPGDTASILLQLGAQLLIRKNSTGYIQANKPKSKEQLRSAFLCGLPQTGPVLAERLLSYFGNIESIMNADEETLVRVKGIGTRGARKIRKFITGDE